MKQLNMIIHSELTPIIRCLASSTLSRRCESALLPAENRPILLQRSDSSAIQHKLYTMRSRGNSSTATAVCEMLLAARVAGVLHHLEARQLCKLACMFSIMCVGCVGR